MENTSSKVAIWFKVVLTFLFIWNLMGIGSFYVHVFISEETLAALPENERALYGQYPLWTEIAFAIAVLGGTIGSLGLLLRRKWAKPILILSLIAIVIQMFHSLVIADSMEVYGPGAVIMPIMVILLGIFLVWLANYATKKEWLK